MAELNLKDIVARCGLTKERLQEECSQEVALKIATKLDDWKMVGHYLGIPPEKLKAIELENNTEDQRRVASLDTWRKGEGRNASYWKLANALNEHRRRDLVELLCKAMVSNSAEESSGQQSIINEVSTDDRSASSSGETMPKNCETGRYTNHQAQIYVTLLNYYTPPLNHKGRGSSWRLW